MTRVFNVTFSVLVAMVLIVALFTIGPMLETRFFPVYSKFTVVSMEPVENGHTRIEVQMTKFRDCVPIGYAWYAGDDINVRQLNVTIRRRAGAMSDTPSRPVGSQMLPDFEVDATPEEISNAVFAEVYSRCHPLWTTRSEVFP